MEFGESEFDGVLVLNLTGRLNAAAAAALDARLAASQAGGARDVLIDMKHVVYMGHSGFRVLIGHSRAIKAAGRKLVLACVPTLVFDVFALNGANAEVMFAGDHDDALAVLRPDAERARAGI
ncbi:MAG: STAS domain-containing protein [Pseudomonadota bacterium]